MKYSEYWKSLMDLYYWVKKEKYFGWDPYDWLISPISSKLPTIFNFLLMQLNVYSPINLRPYYRINKGISNKSIAIFSQAYLLLGDISPEFKIEAKKLLLLLENKKIKLKYGCGWSSYHFEFFGPKHKLVPNIPDIVGTCEAIKAFLLAYKTLMKSRYLKISREAINFLLNELIGHFGNYIYFKYTPNEKDKIVFNVSALALSAISLYLKFAEIDEGIIKVGNRVIKFLLNFQRDNGAWPYSYYLSSNIFYTQLDYHQGFIIDGLIEFLPYVNEELKSKVINSIIKATEFYMKKQFTPNGTSYYRYPIKYPIDIHNQAQGIITFSKLYREFKEIKYLKFAEKIAEWTIKNMQDPAGYFYTHKWPGFVNKIPYMRWGQAWMMLALSTLLSVKLGEDNESADNRSD